MLCVSVFVITLSWVESFTPGRYRVDLQASLPRVVSVTTLYVFDGTSVPLRFSQSRVGLCVYRVSLVLLASSKLSLIDVW